MEIYRIHHFMRMVIFGCGYVGRALAKAAAEAGNEVWIHSRNADSLKSVAAIPEKQKVPGNLHETGWHDTLHGEWDIVFNLVSSAGGGIEGYKTSYIDGNRSIRQWAEKNPVKRFIYTSATSVYPQSDGSWVGESDVPDEQLLSPAGKILHQAEQEILSGDVYAEIIVARLAGIYGPGRHLYLNSLREGVSVLPGDGSAWLNLIYLKDIIDALMHLANCRLDAVSDVINVVDDHPERKQAIVDWLSEHLDLEKIKFDPGISGARGSRRTSPAGLPNRRISNAKLKEVYGWNPKFKSFREGYLDILSE